MIPLTIRLPVPGKAYLQIGTVGGLDTEAVGALATDANDAVDITVETGLLS